MLNQDKINHCIGLLKENYSKSSIITKVIEAVDFDERLHQHLDFLRLGIWTYVPKEWFIRTDIIPDFVFMEFGRGIAIGEEKHLIQRILDAKGTKRKSLAEVTYQNVSKTLKEEMGNLSDLVMFAPISHFVKMHIDWAREAGSIVIYQNELIVESQHIPLFWSSKYVDFSDFIIVRKSFGRWIAKPCISERLSVEMFESSERPDQMELKAQTLFYLDIKDPQQILILKQ
ncbi:MAG: hypothetical protein QXX79_00110 [Candidatus Bathyarchaeia archaeon]